MIDDVRDAFGRAAIEHRRRTPVHAALCEAVAADRAVLTLLEAAPSDRRTPTLLLAALHRSVLADPTCDLAAWYPTITSTPRTDDLRRALSAHVSARATDLGDTLRRRTVQTNEVGRCGLLLPALSAVGEEVGDLAVLDVGASAGLTLLLDRYRYHYQPGGRLGPVSSVEITVDLRGSVPVPTSLPTISGRLGLDTDPIDLSDPDDELWLRSCIWADEVGRLRRLEAAIVLARHTPVEVRRGDAVDDLAAAVSDVGGLGHPVVVNTWCLNYLPPDRRRTYIDTLEALGARTDLTWIYAESPADAPELPCDRRLLGHSVTALTSVQWRNGLRTVDHLGVAHPHGHWLHWKDEMDRRG